MLLKTGLFVVASIFFWQLRALAEDEHPLSTAQQEKMNKSFDATIAATTKRIESNPKNVRLYSQRGDAFFFRARFKEAVADYEKMIELNPALEAGHWRRGIAYFYAEQFKKAAHQFEIYHSVDNVDRENGIWRFLSQTKAYGVNKARKGLLKYEKDDRQPFPSVYRLFAGETTPAAIVKEIESADISKSDRSKRLFYAHLYIGLNEAVGDSSERATAHLRKAVANQWGAEARGGPGYMWHVGRLHYDLLRARQKTKLQSKTKKEKAK